jgi:cell division protein FtsW (lipid II flippase)
MIARPHVIRRGKMMIGYMKRHEQYVNQMLEKELSEEARRELREYHDRQILWMQHERMVHLIVMLFVCLFALLALGFTILNPIPPYFVLFALLMILSVAYVIHYYRLENGVQRWYDLSDRIKARPRL